MSFPLCVCACALQLMERAKVSGSLDLPPELLEVMEQLQQGAGSPPSPTLSRSSSLRRSLPTSKVDPA